LYIFSNRYLASGSVFLISGGFGCLNKNPVNQVSLPAKTNEALTKAKGFFILFD
jgi:hypothetical protein